MPIEKLMLSITRAMAVICLFWVAGCDPDGRKDCDWVLEPEPNNTQEVEAGYIPVCARNRKTMKEDCRMQATLEFAKKVYGRKFRLSEVEYSNKTYPKTVVDLTYCDKGKK